MKKIGVLLSGCGFKDGAEIHESVVTLLAINRAGAKAICLAPDVELDEINHLTGEPTGMKRNVLVESARIARGDVRDIATVTGEELDALVIPGGFGAAKNLCDFALAGERAQAHPEVARLVQEIFLAKKPIGAICIAPAAIASILGQEIHPELTIGNDAGTARALEQMGATHRDCAVREFHVDRKNKIVSTPAYMLAEQISEAAEGIEKLVREVIALT